MSGESRRSGAEKSLALSEGANLEWIADYAGTSVAVIERRYGRYMHQDGLDPLIRAPPLSSFRLFSVFQDARWAIREPPINSVPDNRGSMLRHCSDPIADEVGDDHGGSGKRKGCGAWWGLDERRIDGARDGCEQYNDWEMA